MQYHYNLQGARIISTSALHAACPSPGSPSRPGITRILPDGILYGRTEASQKKRAVSYYFAPMLHCPPLAAMSDDQREEFSCIGSGVLAQNS